MTRYLLAGFVACAALHIVALITGATPLERATKALLMPLLAARVLSRDGRRLIAAALLLSAAGDIALQFNAGIGIFIAGMICFAAAHVCYVRFFIGSGVLPGLRRYWPIPVGYAVLWAALMTAIWPDLGALQAPTALYSLLLTATAVTSAGYGPRTGVGGALFLLSDAFLGLNMADMELPLSDVWVMVTYIAAQYLIASGAMATPRGAAEPQTGWVAERLPGPPVA
jgi:uncharacterized membrane protein YhhN